MRTDKSKKNISFIQSILIFAVLLSTLNSCKSADNGQISETVAQKTEAAFTYEILAKGNSWVTNDASANNQIITPQGIRNWNNQETVIKTYFKTEQNGELHLGLRLDAVDAGTKIKVGVGETIKDITIETSGKQDVSLGQFQIAKPGYQTIEITGLTITGNSYADIDAFLISGPATKGKVYFIKDDFYFGRRGPSVHLTYDMPQNKEVEYFYNEINVPEGEDVIGSYFMANGFMDGYFGIQVNSETERRILFSVWSPFDTQDPKDIPEDQKILLLGKGEGVYSGEFGNEGSGGQSFKVFPWKAATTYKFLLKGVPAENNSTDYTAYFYTPEQDEWLLIASFRRPKGSRYLKNLYSFLENFDTKTGYIPREANYNNQWVYTTDKEWIELTQVKFTADATARKESRMDYAGGAKENEFFMKNCGFFDDMTPIDTQFTRTPNGVAPTIDLDQLAVPRK